MARLGKSTLICTIHSLIGQWNETIAWLTLAAASHDGDPAAVTWLTDFTIY
jgi:hypothetical protein